SCFSLGAGPEGRGSGSPNALLSHEKRAKLKRTSEKKRTARRRGMMKGIECTPPWRAIQRGDQKRTKHYRTRKRGARSPLTRGAVLRRLVDPDAPLPYNRLSRMPRLAFCRFRTATSFLILPFSVLTP